MDDHVVHVRVDDEALEAAHSEDQGVHAIGDLQLLG